MANSTSLRYRSTAINFLILVLNLNYFSYESSNFNYRIGDVVFK